MKVTRVRIVTEGCIPGEVKERKDLESKSVNEEQARARAIALTQELRHTREVIRVKIVDVGSYRLALQPRVVNLPRGLN